MENPFFFKGLQLHVLMCNNPKHCQPTNVSHKLDGVGITVQTESMHHLTKTGILTHCECVPVSMYTM